ncbi:MAG: class I SAM-dependent methyltransferase [Candidatus Omnitrophica bacterium]|nr:class I SAM-dependent methyltransferase [Candidatus Omnitrophota bacterium]
MADYYPKSKVEVKGFTARYYDKLMNIITFGSYSSFIEKVVKLMKIRSLDRILDLGAGTGRNACLMMKYLSKGDFRDPSALRPQDASSLMGKNLPRGQLIGTDISWEMISQFKKKCANFPNAKIVYTKIDQSLAFEKEFDKVFISFVLHGFPQDARETITDNAYQALKKDGEFYIVDWNEFDLKTLPFYQRTFFKLIECPYAFDFIQRDWKKILTNHNFDGFEEYFFFKGFVRLLKAKKIV